MTDKIEYNQAGTVLTMHCTDGTVKVFDLKVVMPAQRWGTDPYYVWEQRPLPAVTLNGIRVVQCRPGERPLVHIQGWDPHMNADDCRDNAARKWYYETQIRPHWKKEGK